MAINTPTQEIATTSTADASSLTSGSFTVPSGGMIVVSGQACRIGGLTSLSISDSQSLTWTERHSFTTTSGAASGLGKIWTAVSNGSSMTVTITPNANCLRWTLHVTGVDGTASIEFVQSKGASGDSTAAAVTLDSALDSASSCLVSCFFKNGTAAVTEDGAYTQLSENSTGGGNDCMGHVAYDNGGGDTNVSHSWTGTAAWDIGLLELKEAAGAAGNPWYYYAQLAALGG